MGPPDGCGFDQEGNLWVTLFLANKLVAITLDGSLETLAHDPSGETLVAPTNVSWGGDDMRELHERYQIAQRRVVHQHTDGAVGFDRRVYDALARLVLRDVAGNGRRLTALLLDLSGLLGAWRVHDADR